MRDARARAGGSRGREGEREARVRVRRSERCGWERERDASERGLQDLAAMEVGFIYGLWELNFVSSFHLL